MKYITFVFVLALLISASGMASAQGRQVGARRIVLDNSDNVAANNVYLIDVGGSMGIDNTGNATGTFPASSTMLTLFAGSKTTNLRLDGGATGLNINGATSNALTISNGNLILGSTVNTVPSGNTIPNGQSVVDVSNNGVGGSVATVTLPVGATNGQTVFVTTEDPDGVKITVGLNSVTLSSAEVGKFMFINGTWRIEH